jgi:copper resistance protein C
VTGFSTTAEIDAARRDFAVSALAWKADRVRMVARSAVTLAAASALVLASIGPAQAHDSLVASTPAAHSTIETLPAEFSVTMNEPLRDLSGKHSGFALEVVDAQGLYYGDGCLRITGPTLSMGSSLGEAGDYRMLWQVVSEDGHTASGEVPFHWSPQQATGTAGLVAPPKCGGGSAKTPVPLPTAGPQRPRATVGDVVLIGAIVAVLVLAALASAVMLSRRRRP